MEGLFQPLLFILARSSRNQLIRQIEFLKTENETLRRRIKKKHLVLRPEKSRRLVELEERIGPAVKHVLTVARYSTYRRWVRRQKEVVWLYRAGPLTRNPLVAAATCGLDSPGPPLLALVDSSGFRPNNRREPCRMALLRVHSAGAK